MKEVRLQKNEMADHSALAGETSINLNTLRKWSTIGEHA